VLNFKELKYLRQENTGTWLKKMAQKNESTKKTASKNVSAKKFVEDVVAGAVEDANTTSSSSHLGIPPLSSTPTVPSLARDPVEEFDSTITSSQEGSLAFKSYYCDFVSGALMGLHYATLHLGPCTCCIPVEPLCSC
jgi:hypothetical protein